MKGRHEAADPAEAQEAPRRVKQPDFSWSGRIMVLLHTRLEKMGQYVTEQKRCHTEERADNQPSLEHAG